MYGTDKSKLAGGGLVVVMVMVVIVVVVVVVVVAWSATERERADDGSRGGEGCDR
jgi:uncharacterized membrane protein